MNPNFNQNPKNMYNNPYQMTNQTVNNNLYLQNNIMNPAQQQPYSEYMKYINYYNPLIIQNYYAMFNQMNYNNPNNQFGNYFSSPYTMNQQPNNYKKTQANPELDEELRKWIDSRKRNFPTKCKVDEKGNLERIREDSGILSKLEIKLREKVKILSQINKKGNRNRNNNNNDNRRKHKQRKRRIEETEDGEIVEQNNEALGEIEKVPDQPKKSKAVQKQRKYFRYRKNKLYEEMIKSDKIKEMNIILQAFRYFVNENLV
jgi:hypothetical protein